MNSKYAVARWLGQREWQAALAAALNSAPFFTDLRRAPLARHLFGQRSMDR